MARTKIRRSTSKSLEKQTAQQNNENESSEKAEALIPLLISTISQSISFLSSNDLLLSPSHSLSLSSALSNSALSLSSLLSLTKLDTTTLTIVNKPPPPPPTTTFPYFHRIININDPTLFPSHFHLSKPTFYLLLQTITPTLNSTSTTPFPPDLKLAAFLFRLSHAAPFSFISTRFFSSSPPLACRAFYEVSKSILQSLSHLFDLSTHNTKRVVEGFNWMSLKKCCGVLSFFRVPVSGPLRGGSVLAQFVVDSEGRFLDLSVGWHGSMTPVMVIPKTKLYSSVVRDSVLLMNKGYFIGGSCCPLLHWLLTPYDKVDNARKEMFNAVHGRGMGLAERAVKRLRGRWKLVKTEWKEECVEALPYVVVASCLLHNYLIKCSEAVMEDEEDGVGMDLGFEEFDGKGEEKGKRRRSWIASQLSPAPTPTNV